MQGRPPVPGGRQGSSHPKTAPRWAALNLLQAAILSGPGHHVPLWLNVKCVGGVWGVQRASVRGGRAGDP